MRFILTLLAITFFYAPAFADDKLNVIASTTIIADLVKNVAGDQAQVVSIVPPNGDPHSYEPKPSDVRAINRANIIFINGLGFETWLERLMQNSGYKGMVVKCADGITTQPFASDDFDKSDKGGFYRGSNRDAKGRIVDPHGWQDPSNTKIYVQNIVKFLSAKDPAHASVYASNGAAYVQKLDALNAKTKQEFLSIPAVNKNILTTHDAFGYFARAYGLMLHAASEKTTGEASAAHMAELINDIKANKIKAIFIENMSNPQMINQIAQETGIAVGGKLYADALDEIGTPAGTYLGMMEENIKTITAALKVSAKITDKAAPLAQPDESDLPEEPTDLTAK